MFKGFVVMIVMPLVSVLTSAPCLSEEVDERVNAAIVKYTDPKISLEYSVVVEDATSFLREYLKKLYPSVEVIPSELSRRQQLPMGIVSATYRLNNNKTAVRRMCVAVDLLLGNRQTKTIPVWFEVRATKMGLVAVSSLQKGALLRPELVRISPVEVTRYGEPIALDQIDRYRLSEGVGEGMPVGIRAVERLSAVYRGQEVVIRIEQGRILFEISAVAMEGGNIGKTVKVRRLRDGAYLRTKVVDTGIVMLDGV